MCVVRVCDVVDGMCVCVCVCDVKIDSKLESPKQVEHPKINTSYKNLCILLVLLHITTLKKFDLLTFADMFQLFVTPEN